MTKFINAKEIAQIAECGINRAREIKNEVNEIVRQKGYRVVNQNKAPRNLVIEYLGLEENT